MGVPHVLDVGRSVGDLIRGLVDEVVAACPGQTEYRYVSYLRRAERPGLAPIADAYERAGARPLLLTGLPRFDSVEATKILALLIGEAVGRCVGYADYNHSYLTDIRPTPLSTEESAGFDLLGMHNDFSWAADSCRPRTLVLVPHLATGSVPRTLLAPAQDVVELLSPHTRRILGESVFEARNGGSLAWKYQRIQRMALLTEQDGRLRLKLNFDTFTPAADLDPQPAADATEALREAHETALKVGVGQGHAIRKGEALLIPNDYCAHGRDRIEPGACERLLLRSYVVPRDVAAQHPSTMLQLSQ
jgi:hypothetical protein